MNIVLHIDEKSNEPLYVQLYEGIKKEIMEGRLKAGTAIPSIRQLAKTLHMSKTTVESTYHQLVTEGYLYSVEKKGYYVSEINHMWLHPTGQGLKVKPYAKDKIVYNLTNAHMEEEAFNMNLWKKVVDRTIAEEKDALLEQGEVQGERSLREQIIEYIYQARGVKAVPEQVVVGAGIQTLLQLLTYLFVQLNQKQIGFEDPGFNRAKHVFRHHALKLIPIKVNEEGIDVEALNKALVDVCYISPSHQFPTGTVMPINKRLELIHWAASKEAYIIEDDYNSEIRYQGRPIPSLQGLDHGERVIYLGSFSTVFLPSIRISYMILPTTLLESYYQIKDQYAQTASKLEQLSMAVYMKEGLFDKHIRRLKVYYTKKNEKVKKMIQTLFKDLAYLSGGDSGFNFNMVVKTHLEEQKIKELCKERGILINVLSDYTVKKDEEHYPVLIISYKGVKLEVLEEALKIIYSLCFLQKGD